MLMVVAYMFLGRQVSLGRQFAPTDEMVAMSAPDAAMEMEEMPQRADPGQKRSVAVPRVRDYFPETLLWQPELITDDNGMATLELPLADSITTWRMTASAVSSQGRMGGGE